MLHKNQHDPEVVQNKLKQQDFLFIPANETEEYQATQRNYQPFQCLSSKRHILSECFHVWLLELSELSESRLRG